MWEDIIQKAKDGGLDVVETYVFWNVHEPSPGNVLSLRSFPSLFAFVFPSYPCIVLEIFFGF